MRDAPSYYVLSCCEVSLNLLRWFLGCCWDTVLASGLVAALALGVGSESCGGWSGGANVLGKLPAPGRSINLDYSRARAYCACNRCEWGLFGHFFSRLSLLFSFSLSMRDGPI